MQFFKYLVAIVLLFVVFVIGSVVVLKGTNHSSQELAVNLIDENLVYKMCKDIDFDVISNYLHHPDVKVRASALLVWSSLGKVRPPDAKGALATNVVIAMIASDEYPFSWMDYGGRLSSDLLEVLHKQKKTFLLYGKASYVDSYSLTISAYVYRIKSFSAELLPRPKTWLLISTDICF